jgi:hypothetical protein
MTKTRTVWHSTDGGRTWRQIEVPAGTIAYNTAGEWDDGCGNRYSDRSPKEKRRAS